MLENFRLLDADCGIYFDVMCTRR